MSYIERAITPNEIDLIIEEDGVLYPIEIKMSGNPKANMGATNPVLDKIKEKTRGMGVILIQLLCIILLFFHIITPYLEK